VEPGVGAGVLTALQSPQPPPVEAALTALIKPVHDAVTFLLEYQPPNLCLVIATRADPPLPLARLRARDQLTELRQTDLRFTTEEAAAFLNQVMGLGLTDEDVAALEARTEGWIAGLQMAALSIQEQEDVAAFIHALTGSDRYILTV